MSCGSCCPHGAGTTLASVSPLHTGVNALFFQLGNCTRTLTWRLQPHLLQGKLLEQPAPDLPKPKMLKQVHPVWDVLHKHKGSSDGGRRGIAGERDQLVPCVCRQAERAAVGGLAHSTTAARHRCYCADISLSDVPYFHPSSHKCILLFACLLSFNCILFHVVSLHRTALHRMALHLMSLHNIAFRYMLYHVMPLHFISLYVLACHILALHFMSLHAIACHAISQHLTLLHAVSYPVLALHFISLHAIPLHATAHRAIACHPTAWHLVACQSMPCHCTAFPHAAFHCISFHCMSSYALPHHCTSFCFTALHCTACHIASCSCTAWCVIELCCTFLPRGHCQTAQTHSQAHGKPSSTWELFLQAAGGLLYSVHM